MMHIYMRVCVCVPWIFLCACNNVQIEDCKHLPDTEIPWLTDPSNYTVTIDLEHKSITACTISSGCYCLQHIVNDSVVPQVLPIVIQDGVSINFTAPNGIPIQLYKSTMDMFESCTLNSNESSQSINMTASSWELSPDQLTVGSNLYICVDTNGSNVSCQDGFRINITVKANDCMGSTSGGICSGHGRCTSLMNESAYTCKCVDEYGGKLCQTVHDDDHKLYGCTENNCQNGGTCSETAACECPPYVAGIFCETILNKCKSSPCVNGICVERAEGYQCYCVPGFHGIKCELEYNECLSSPCLNHGTCIDRTDKYECSCSHGYSGIKCETKLDLCTSNPCHSNSTCTDIGDTFTCICTHGHTGLLCEQRVKTCTSNPCKNYGTCVELEHGYQCICPVTFAGLHCEYMMDVFAPPMEGADLSGEAHKHNLYIVAATLGSMVLIVVSVIVACYCKIYETYKQIMWRRLRYHRKRSNSCPDLETCNNEPSYIGKHRLSADAIWEATSLCHENAAFENFTNHQTFSSMQI